MDTLPNSTDLGNIVVAGTETVSVLLARIDEKLTRALETDKDHELRIRALEYKVWTSSIVTSIASAAVTAGAIKMFNLG